MPSESPGAAAACGGDGERDGSQRETAAAPAGEETEGAVEPAQSGLRMHTTHTPSTVCM